MEKKWIDWTEDCPNCGDDTEVLTNAPQDAETAQAYDGDKAKCVSCKWRGSVVVNGEDEDGNGVAWLDEGNLEELNKEDAE